MSQRQGSMPGTLRLALAVQPHTFFSSCPWGITNEGCTPTPGLPPSVGPASDLLSSRHIPRTSLRGLAFTGDLLGFLFTISPLYLAHRGARTFGKGVEEEAKVGVPITAVSLEKLRPDHCVVSQLCS